jgi:hypothetical protein
MNMISATPPRPIGLTLPAPTPNTARGSGAFSASISELRLSELRRGLSYHRGGRQRRSGEDHRVLRGSSGEAQGSIIEIIRLASCAHIINVLVYHSSIARHRGRLARWPLLPLFLRLRPDFGRVEPRKRSQAQEREQRKSDIRQSRLPGTSRGFRDRPQANPTASEDVRTITNGMGAANVLSKI